MIRLTFTVDNISTVILVYNQIQIQKATTESGPFSQEIGLGPIDLLSGTAIYSVNDVNGISTDWYVSRYYSTITGYASEWSSPVLGEVGDIFYNPLYPNEVSYGSSQKLVIDRVRRLIGDPIRLRREYGEEALSRLHLDSKTVELPETGWPVSIIMGGTTYNDVSNPSVNDYRYLRFNNYIGDICDECVTYSGCGGLLSKSIPSGVDIWYYTFRNSDRQIMDAYNNCPIPYPLTESTATAEVYMLQTAIDIIRGELWEDSVEDGASLRDEGTQYNPEPGIKIRKQILDDLQKKLDTLVKILMMSGISGILID